MTDCSVVGEAEGEVVVGELGLLVGVGEPGVVEVPKNGMRKVRFVVELE